MTKARAACSSAEPEDSRDLDSALPNHGTGEPYAMQDAESLGIAFFLLILHKAESNTIG
jgi:hypothetical protein